MPGQSNEAILYDIRRLLVGVLTGSETLSIATGAGGSSSFTAMPGISDNTVLNDIRRILEAVRDGSESFNVVGGGTGGGGEITTYEIGFTQSDLTVANLLPVTHNLGSRPSGVIIWSAAGEPVEPDNLIHLTVNSLQVDLSSFVPISGTWRVSIAP